MMNEACMFVSRRRASVVVPIFREPSAMVAKYKACAPIAASNKCAAAAATFEPWACLQLCDEDTGILEYPKQNDDANYKCATCRGATLPCTTSVVTRLLMCVNVLITPMLLVIHAFKIYVVPCVMVYGKPERAAPLTSPATPRPLPRRTCRHEGGVLRDEELRVLDLETPLLRGELLVQGRRVSG